MVSRLSLSWQILCLLKSFLSPMLINYIYSLILFYNIQQMNLILSLLIRIRFECKHAKHLKELTQYIEPRLESKGLPNILHTQCSAPEAQNTRLYFPVNAHKQRCAAIKLYSEGRRTFSKSDIRSLMR